MLFSLNTLTTKRASLWLSVAALILALIAGLAYTPTLSQVSANEKNKSSNKSEKEKSKKSKDDDDDDKDDDDDDDNDDDDEKDDDEKDDDDDDDDNEKQEVKPTPTANTKEAMAREEKERKKVEEQKSKEAAKAAKSSKSSSKIDTDANRGVVPAAVNNADLETVLATVETDPVPSGGDAADDPAIWIHPTNRAMSTIIGTNKAGGLAVYDLSGKQIQYLAEGLPDNVDLRDGFMLGGQKVSLVTASDRKANSIMIYKVNPETRQLENVAARVIKHGLTVYGMCMYRSAKTGKTYYFGNSKSGDVEQYELFDNGSGKVDAKVVRKFKVGQVVEGCVADDELGHFYISEEPVGLWKYGAEPDAGTQRTQVGKAGDGNLHADVEGVTIAYGPNGTGYVIVSSQGNYSYVVYKREGNNEFVKKFKIGDGAIDGAEETDGIDVTTVPLGDKFPKGVFVVQDGFNDGGKKAQNFKLVPLEAIIK